MPGADVVQPGGDVFLAYQAAAVPCSFYAWIRFQRFPAALFEGQYRGGLIQPTGAGAGSSGAPSAAAALAYVCVARSDFLGAGVAAGAPRPGRAGVGL